MKPFFEKKLRGLLYKCDEKYITFYILADEMATDTNKFLKTYFTGQNKTITPTTFKVKITGKSKAHLDKAQQVQILPQELINQVVEINVIVKHYNFLQADKKIIGWNMTLNEMHPI